MSKKVGKESVSQKSAAEFFSEHQQIAGFDNPGKSLFTTIREFVENSLDAAESMHVLPDIEVHIVEYTEQEHNSKHGIDRGVIKAAAATTTTTNEEESMAVGGGKKGKKSVEGKEKDQMYYSVSCKDNGCGIPESSIGDMLGRVLSGSKHGVRQTRGKFGLGAKMALIWSKKSSGLPITIRTAHSTQADVSPSLVTTVVLDIDIYKNAPKTISTKSVTNHSNWRGTEISVTIAGNWGVYRSRVLQYFQQLAVITPYASLVVDFKCSRDDKKSFRASFERRSEQMPPIASTILPHPKSLNNITLSNMLKETKTASVSKFLTQDLSGVVSSVANTMVNALGISDTRPNGLSSSQVAALFQTLRDEKQIKPPLATCLSPAGEYNMRLGVLKELRPKLIATFTEKPGSVEGHPFLVEAAVSIGGERVREGINVYRFANRIPLLFETGADVVTQVAQKRIAWSSYHIDPKKDNVGVYVSVVSTRIPFKGTSKEYIGDDVTELMHAVRKAIQGCCQQLRVNLAKSLAQKEGHERKKTLIKYIPDVTRAVIDVLKKIQAKENGTGAASSSSSSSSSSSIVGQKRKLLSDLSKGLLSVDTLSNRMHNAVERLEAESALLAAAAGGINGAGGAKRIKLVLPRERVIDRVGGPVMAKGKDKTGAFIHPSFILLSH